MATSVINTTPTPVQFPIQVKKEIVFLAESQMDLDYLNNLDKEQDFILDLGEFSDSIALKVISVDNVTL